MTPHLELYRDIRYEWRFRAVAGNGQVIATGESHKRRWNARRAAKAAFPGWPIHIIRPTVIDK